MIEAPSSKPSPDSNGRLARTALVLAQLLALHALHAKGLPPAWWTLHPLNPDGLEGSISSADDDATARAAITAWAEALNVPVSEEHRTAGNETYTIFRLTTDFMGVNVGLRTHVDVRSTSSS